MSAGTAPEDHDLVTVELRSVPIDVYRVTAEHVDELVREFALIRARQRGQGRSVPARLLALMDELEARFGSFTTGNTEDLQAALRRGVGSIDLVYRVPRPAREAALTLEALLDEADAYCRAGTELMTLATPTEALRFRRWFLRQFVEQIDGAEPVSWPSWALAAGPAAPECTA